MQLLRSKFPALIGVCLLAGVATPVPAAAEETAETPSAETPAPDAPSSRAPAAKPAAATKKTAAPAADKKLLRIVYLGKEYDEPLPLSYAEKEITDKGIQGARLMLKEANQAGNFVGYAFEMDEVIVPEDGDVVAKAKERLAAGDRFFIADLEPDDLLAVADLPEAKDALFMNIRSSATKLRQEECRQNVFHIIPDYAMRADAIAQYLIWKKWPKWYVVRRDTPEDQDYVAQVERSAKRFGGKVVEDHLYDLPPGARNLDSGHQQIQQQMAQETERAPEHDVVWAINSDDDFGDYLMYRTTLPRPVVGTQGLQATAWDKSYTESGGMHFQNAIPKLANRAPVERDYTAWLGFRSLADAAMKSGTVDPKGVKDYMLSDQFRLEAFKGQALSFRPWDHQMRQPVILGGARACLSRRRRRKASCTRPTSPTRSVSISPNPSASSKRDLRLRGSGDARGVFPPALWRLPILQHSRQGPKTKFLSGAARLGMAAFPRPATVATKIATTWHWSDEAPVPFWELSLRSWRNNAPSGWTIDPSVRCALSRARRPETEGREKPSDNNNQTWKRSRHETEFTCFPAAACPLLWDGDRGLPFLIDSDWIFAGRRRRRGGAGGSQDAAGTQVQERCAGRGHAGCQREEADARLLPRQEI
ncbi:hypothetical protein AUC68_10980 [Methyloceanibacter methanicus]|uniref:Leucine-binding protein domain-containing protein n=1 Tax=Methyloceanibacter methanicus TaxID=1774968 RepID=A0A1E3VWY2_9HYPH|nr:ABC transporter substrate-binding protein [Methyloceanibacter methanicus]ODR98022.1 hypothetical protein AUC68_10980 [Methyloceanibacter methanicus]